MRTEYIKSIQQQTKPHQSDIKIHLYTDNQAAHDIIHGTTSIRRIRHIEMAYHYSREKIQKTTHSLTKVNGKTNNPADALTKALPKYKHQHYIQRILNTDTVICCTKK